MATSSSLDTSSDVARAHDDPPWSFCGDRRDPEFGSLFAWPGALGAIALTFDRRGRHHALTLFDAGPLFHAGVVSELVLHGRRFSVVASDALREAS